MSKSLKNTRSMIERLRRILRHCRNLFCFMKTKKDPGTSQSCSPREVHSFSENRSEASGPPHQDELSTGDSSQIIVVADPPSIGCTKIDETTGSDAKMKMEQAEKEEHSFQNPSEDFLHGAYCEQLESSKETSSQAHRIENCKQMLRALQADMSPRSSLVDEQQRQPVPKSGLEVKSSDKCGEISESTTSVGCYVHGACSISQMKRSMRGVSEVPGGGDIASNIELLHSERSPVEVTTLHGSGSMDSNIKVPVEGEESKEEKVVSNGDVLSTGCRSTDARNRINQGDSTDGDTFDSAGTYCTDSDDGDVDFESTSSSLASNTKSFASCLYSFHRKPFRYRNVMRFGQLCTEKGEVPEFKVNECKIPCHCVSSVDA